MLVKKSIIPVTSSLLEIITYYSEFWKGIRVDSIPANVKLKDINAYFVGVISNKLSTDVQANQSFQRKITKVMFP